MKVEINSRGMKTNGSRQGESKEVGRICPTYIVHLYERLKILFKRKTTREETLTMQEKENNTNKKPHRTLPSPSLLTHTERFSFS